MLVGSLCLIASSLNVGQEYLSSAPNNRFISRFLKTPKMCHMHEETNLSSCICIFFYSYLFTSSFGGKEEFGHCVCLTYSCSFHSLFIVIIITLPALNMEDIQQNLSLYTDSYLTHIPLQN